MEPRQRSRKGCLTCRQKRKKCDEIKPVCGRCKDANDCMWPVASKLASYYTRLPRIQPRPPLDSKIAKELCPQIESIPTSILENNYESDAYVEHINMPTEVTAGSNYHGFVSYPLLDFAPTTPNGANSLLELGDSLPTSSSNSFTVQHGLIRTAGISTSNELAYMGKGLRGYSVDEDEEETFKIPEWLQGTLQLIGLYLPIDTPPQYRVQWSSAIDSYFAVIVRYSYDQTKLPVLIGDFVVRQCCVESVRLGVLGTSMICYSYLNPELPQAPIRRHAKELVDAAVAALQFEMTLAYTTLDAQLAGISEILGFYYFIGDFGGYMRCIDLALPIVQELVGTAPVSIHKLHGPETLEIRHFAWCDVFGAITTSRPTKLVYDCNVDTLFHKNQQGPESEISDSGLEWMCGLPDAFLLLMIQIINLKHTPLPLAERITRAATIEATIRGWQVWPTGVTNSTMRMQRISAQEIWRHFVILYLYQAVYKASPSHEIVKQSVKQIIKLASTLRPGQNPDCLLDIPYFFAGTFAISPEDRRFLRDRVVKCDIDPYKCTFANALDELWGQSPINKYVDWTERSPPLVLF